MRVMFFAVCGLLAACGPAEAPAPDSPETTAAEWTVTPQISPPGEAEFRAAWSAQCGASEDEVGSAICRAQALGADGFSCDFALGDDDYRRYSADLARNSDMWVLADPDETCSVADPE